jgi:hypothetical protein
MLARAIKPGLNLRITVYPFRERSVDEEYSMAPMAQAMPNPDRDFPARQQAFLLPKLN